jgi:hypothetical protein
MPTVERKTVLLVFCNRPEPVGELRREEGLALAVFTVAGARTVPQSHERRSRIEAAPRR